MPKKVLSEEHKRKIGDAHRGMKRPASLGIRLREIYKGKPNPHAKGAKSHFWKGGITPKNQAIRCSANYKNWRVSVFERDNYTCQVCGDRGVYLEADHIKPFSEFPELRFEVSNGRTLCKPCHKKTDTYANKQRWKNRGL